MSVSHRSYVIYAFTHILQSLVHRLLSPLSTFRPPISPLEPHDTKLLELSKQINGVAPSLLAKLQEEPEISDLCPLDEKASNRIECASNIESRLRAIYERDVKHNGVPPNATPEIRVEAEAPGSPDISISSPDSPTSSQLYSSATLLHSRAYHFSPAHHKHLAALHRLLYLHSCINPAIHSPHLPTLLVPLYIVLLREVDPQELAHAEADTFWLFEAMIGEFSDLLDEESCSLWMRRFSARVASADDELFADLVRFVILFSLSTSQIQCHSSPKDWIQPSHIIQSTRCILHICARL